MSDELISLSIDQVSTTDFEIWVQKVLQVTEGYQFEPTGGMHDGGQDGFMRPIQGSTDHFVQISKQEDTRAKVRSTIEDIRKSRTIKRLIYVTSQTESQRDIVEARWSKEFNVRIEIRDRRWLLIQASLYEELENSLYGYVRSLIDSLQRAGAVKRELNYAERLSILTYLEAEAHSLPSSENFQNLCLDTIIYDCLIGTNPQEGSFKTLDMIETELKHTNSKLVAKAPSSIPERLDFLSSKSNLPRIRKHPGGKYALPYEVRNQFDSGNLALKTQEDAFIASVSKRVDEECKGKNSDIRDYVTPAIRFAIVETFRRQAMNFASSFSGILHEPNIEIFSIFDSHFKSASVPPKILDECNDAAANVFRRICYSSSQDEREYLELLMKYFSVRFVMDGDVAVTQYFSEMAKRLKIYLGTDIIVRCLSETFVRTGSRGMTNALKTLQSAGVKLNITRQVLNETFSHIHATHLTFRNDYESWYRLGSLDEVKHCDRILIRAFFYAHFEPDGHIRKPRDWADFLNQMGSAAWFVEPKRHIDDFGSFLVDKFNFEFTELHELTTKIDNELSNKIADEIIEARDNERTSGYKILALNDAQMALYINAVRQEQKERITNSLYGYNTWWMTEETRILRILKKHGQHDDVVMLPQFLLNHYMLDPTRKRASREDEAITPTLFGLRITDRVDPSAMKKFLKTVGQYAELDDAAARARIRSAANSLKKSKGSRTAGRAHSFH